MGKVNEDQPATALLATIDGTPVEQGIILSGEQWGGLRSWAQRMGHYQAPLPIKFIRVEGDWLYASVGARFEMIIGPHPAHLLILRTALVLNVECYCICGLHDERNAGAGDRACFQLDARHFEMYAQLRRIFYQRYGEYSDDLPVWVVDELAAMRALALAS
jgi:hypothetical protein